MRQRCWGWVALSLILPVLIAGAACSVKQRVNAETSLARALISDQQSEQIGQQVHAELAAKGVRYVNDRRVTGYVERVAGKIFDLARRDRPGVNFHVHVIDDAKTVNAFAAPGGHVYVYSGLLLAADNEAEVAGVLAHESGHVAGRHVERAMVNAYGLEALAAMALGNDPSRTKQLAASLIGTGLLRAHSRSEEIEADEYGARYISRLGYDPNALITFFQKLQAGESRTPTVLAWLNTHPVSGERISNLRDYIAKNGLGGSTLGQVQHREIKQNLSASARRS